MLNPARTIRSKVAFSAQPEAASSIVFFAFALFTMFGVVQLVLLLHPRGPALYSYGEFAYVCLSFTAKAGMAALFLALSLVPERVKSVTDVNVLY